MIFDKMHRNAFCENVDDLLANNYMCIRTYSSVIEAYTGWIQFRRFSISLM